MIPPYLRGPQQGQEGAELEALQADVMRFVAIIGLCLAAIFSLLKGLESAPATHPGTAPAAATSPQPAAIRAGTAVPDSPMPPPAPQSQSQRQPEPEPEPEPEAGKQEPEADGQPQIEGYTLRFASVQVLHSLLAEESIALVAINPGGYWHYQPRRRAFSPGPAPGDYYRMDAATVPPLLRDWLQAAGVQPQAWGVVLPPPMRAQLEAIMHRQRGADLIIDASGTVLIGHLQ